MGPRSLDAGAVPFLWLRLIERQPRCLPPLGSPRFSSFVRSPILFSTGMCHRPHSPLPLPVSSVPSSRVQVDFLFRFPLLDPGTLIRFQITSNDDVELPQVGFCFASDFLTVYWPTPYGGPRPFFGFRSGVAFKGESLSRFIVPGPRITTIVCSWNFFFSASARCLTVSQRYLALGR